IPAASPKHIAVDDPAIGVDDPAGVVVTDSHAYVIDLSGDTVTVIDTSDNSVEKTIDVGRTPIFGTVSGGRLYVVNVSDSSVSVIDTTSNQVVDTITGMTPGVFAPVASPDGTRLYVAQQ